MELIFFIVMAAVALLVLFVKDVKLTIIVWFIIFIIYSFITRSGAQGDDMRDYYSRLGSECICHLRELLYYYITIYLIKLIRNGVYTFFLLDIILAGSTIWSLNRLDDGEGSLLSISPTILTSYVFLLGQQNIYRQHMAFVVFLVSLSLRKKTTIPSLIIFIGSCLIHNSLAILAGYWYDEKRGTKRGMLRGSLITLLISVLFTIFTHQLFGGYHDTGANTSFVYFIIAAIIVFLLLYSKLGQMKVLLRFPSLENMFLFTPIFLSPLYGAIIERFLMMFIVLLVIDLCRYRSLYGFSKTVTDLFSYSALVIPVFLFGSTLYFLNM